jgi:hypothetical protein
LLVHEEHGLRCESGCGNRREFKILSLYESHPTDLSREELINEAMKFLECMDDISSLTMYTDEASKASMFWLSSIEKSLDNLNTVMILL